MNFLIAHKVRGEPAFDIAEQMDCPECTAGCPECDGLGYWWIIPTSGHRAYPYWTVKLSKLDYVFKSDGSVPNLICSMPPDCPDHYPSKHEPPPADLSAIIARLLPKRDPIKRRL